MTDPAPPPIVVRLDEEAKSPYRVVVEVAGTTLRGDAGHLGWNDQLPGENKSLYKQTVTLTCLVEQWSRALEDLAFDGGLAYLPYSFEDESIGCLSVCPRDDGTVELGSVELPIYGVDVPPADYQPDRFWRRAGTVDTYPRYREGLHAVIGWDELVSGVDAAVEELAGRVAWRPNPPLSGGIATISGSPSPVLVRVSRREAPFSHEPQQRAVWRGRIAGMADAGAVERRIDVESRDLRTLAGMLRAVGESTDGDSSGVFDLSFWISSPAASGSGLWSVAIDELGLTVLLDAGERAMTAMSFDALADRLERAPFGYDPAAPSADLPST